MVRSLRKSNQRDMSEKMASLGPDPQPECRDEHTASLRLSRATPSSRRLLLKLQNGKAQTLAGEFQNLLKLATRGEMNAGIVPFYQRAAWLLPIPTRNAGQILLCPRRRVNHPKVAICVATSVVAESFCGPPRAEASWTVHGEWTNFCHCSRLLPGKRCPSSHRTVA